MFAVTITLGGCKTPAPGLIEPGQKPLTGEEIKELLVGSSVVGSTQDIYTGGAIFGSNYTIFYPSYGKFRGSLGYATDQGVWSVRGNIYCRTWDNWLDNEETCYRFYKKGNKVIKVALSGFIRVQTLKPGNPDNL